MQLISAQHFAEAEKCKRKSRDGGKVGTSADWLLEWREGDNNPVSLGLCLEPCPSPMPPPPHVIVREQSHGRIGVSHAFLAASSQTNTPLAMSPLVSVISLQWTPSSNCLLLPLLTCPPCLMSVHLGHYSFCNAESWSEQRPDLAMKRLMSL